MKVTVSIGKSKTKLTLKLNKINSKVFIHSVIHSFVTEWQECTECIRGRIRDGRRWLFRFIVKMIIAPSHVAAINCSRIGSGFNATVALAADITACSTRHIPSLTSASRHLSSELLPRAIFTARCSP